MKGAYVVGTMLVVLSFLLGGIGCAAPTQTTDVITMRVQSMGGATYPSRVMVENLIKMLEERSDGRIQVDYYPAEAVVKTKAAFDAVREGVLDMAVSAPTYHIDRMGIVGDTLWMPLNWDYKKLTKDYRDRGGLHDFYQPYYKKVGLYSVSYQGVPPVVWVGTKSIRTLSDCQGMVFRDFGGGSAQYLPLLGFSTTPIQRAETYEALQRGIIDYTVQSISGLVTGKWYEAAPYVVNCKWFVGGMVLMMNLDYYNNMPSDLQQIFDKSVLDAEKEHWDYSLEAQERDLATLKEAGADYYVLPDDELARWREAMGPYYQQLAEKYGDEWEKFGKVQKKLW